MKTEQNSVDDKLIEKLIKQALDQAYNESIRGAVMQREIDRYGSYSESGFVFDETDVKVSKLYAGLSLFTKSAYAFFYSKVYKTIL